MAAARLRTPKLDRRPAQRADDESAALPRVPARGPRL